MLGILKSDDKRYDELIKLIDKPFIYSDCFSDFINIDTLLIPVMGIDERYYIKGTNINIKDIISHNDINKIICGVKSDKLINLCKNLDIELISFMSNSTYIWANAKLTAEGMLKKIFSDLNDSISDEGILILGYGYCGKALFDYLKPICKNITIYAHDYHDIKELFCRDINISKLDDLNKYTIIINTVANNIITKEKIDNINIDTKVYDISSYPFGFDIDYAHQIGLKINIIPKIPSLYFNKTAAKLIYNEIKEII